MQFINYGHKLWLTIMLKLGRFSTENFLQIEEFHKTENFLSNARLDKLTSSDEKRVLTKRFVR